MSSRAPSGDPIVGRTIAQYEVLARVGGGGMGVVYRARDTRLGRIVALKFLPQPWSHDETARLRFVREAQAASATNHPNICTVHDIQTADDGQLFIVMAYYEGQTLKQRLEGGPLPIDEALDLATQIADGLAKAHAQGIVHRDIKPGNVILTEEGARIVDFGLATFADALKLTIEHSTLGTAAYMAPEQVRGESVDARSDVWAVGVMLYEMLAGHVPFRGSHTEAIAYAVRHENPRQLRGERPEIPEEVEQLVFRAMHKEASVRHQSGRELARALRQVRGQSLPLDLRTVAVPVAGTRPLPEIRAPRLPIAVGAIAVVALVIAAIWVFTPVERVRVVVAPVGNQTGDSDLEQFRFALTHVMTLSLRDARDLHVVPYTTVLESLRRFIDNAADVSNREAIQSLTGNTGAPLVVIPTLLRDGASWRARVELRDPRTSSNVWQHETASVISSLTRDVAFGLASEMAAVVSEHLKTRRTRVREALSRLTWIQPEAWSRPHSIDAARAFTEGVMWYEEFEYAHAQRAFRSAVELDPRNAVALAWLSRTAHLTKNEIEARGTGERAVSALTDMLPPVDSLFVEAVAHEARRDSASAELSYRQLTAERPDDPTWALELAGFFERQGRTSDAVSTYHTALSLDGALVRPRLELCRLYSPSRLNEAVESKAQGQAALEGYRRRGARGGEAQSMLCLADTLAVGTNEERGRARTYIDDAQRIFKELGYEYNMARAEYYLALVAGVEGRFKESISIGEKAMVRARDANNAAVQAPILNNLGAAHVLVGDRLKGADYYQQAYKLYQSWHDESRAAQIQANRGAMLIEYGNPAEGILDVRNALLVFDKLGDKRFQSFCLRVIATYLRNQGRQEEAMRELNKGLAIARERNLADSITVMTTLLALSSFDIGDYERARQLLVEALKGVTGRRSLEARIRLARTYVRLGDFDGARTELDIAEGDLARSPNTALAALVSLVRGELAFESMGPREARRAFERASASWVAALPEPSAIEARGFLALIEAERGRLDVARQLIRSSIDAADRLGHMSLQARCRLLLAELEFGQRRFTEAAAALQALPADDEARTIGPELRAQAHSLGARIHAAQGNIAAAASSSEAARTLLSAIEQRLSQDYRGSFAMRYMVRRLRAE